MTDRLPDDREMASLLYRLETLRRVAEQQGELRAADGRLLWLLSDGRARTLREIADDLNLEQSTVNRQVNATVKAGLLSRSHETGRTAWVFTGTPEGLAAFERSLRQHLGLYDRALAAIPQAHRRDFLDHFAQFVDAYGDELRRAAWSALTQR